jgi:CBS-domain-containing membrane protein
MLPGRMGSLVARDIMTERLVVFSEADPLSHAAQVLRERRISGAPVLGPQGDVVGMLTLTDVVGDVAGRMRELLDRAGSPAGHADWKELDQLLKNAGSPQGTVGERMTRQVVTVHEDAPLVEVARAMCFGHWHRVGVIDVSRRLVGIISTMDVLAALVQASDETGQAQASGER